MAYVPAKIRFHVLERHGYACAYCGGKPPDVRLEVDHVIPTSRNGSDEADNLVACCQTCNIGKGNRIITAFPDGVIPDMSNVSVEPPPEPEKVVIKERRMVTLAYGTKPACGYETGAVKLIAFGYDSLADLYGVSRKTVKRWMNRDVDPLDPLDLRQLFMGKM